MFWEGAFCYHHVVVSEGKNMGTVKSFESIIEPRELGCIVLKVMHHKEAYILGPLHKQAKSHGHEIVRAQKKVSKGRPNTPPKSCSVVTDPHV